jgi:uncharacterized protein (TIGR00251 family)
VIGASAFRATATGVRIDVRVTPRAGSNAVTGVRDGRLLVRVTAPPVDRAANDALIQLLADELDVPRHAIRLVTGATSRTKTVEIASLTPAQVCERLGVSWT